MNAARSCAVPVPVVESVLPVVELVDELVDEVEEGPEVLLELLDESDEPVRPRLESACKTAPIMPPPGGGAGG